jgi:hypothetical protein
MSLHLVLLILRLVSAALLLTFFAVLIWFLYQDIRLNTKSDLELDSPGGQLVVVQSGSSATETGAKIPLRAIVSIGRAPDNVLVVDDEFASTRHAIVYHRENLWWLEDQTSRNGTLLNEHPVDEATVLTQGDLITIGKTTLRFEL